MTKRWKFEFELDSTTIAEMRRLIGHIVEEEGGSPEVEGEVEVAVGEILLNAYRHAYHGQPGPLEIDVSVGENRLEVLIHDDGAPLTEIPTIPRQRPVRVSEGMGLYMVGRLMDEAEILHPDIRGRGTGVRLVKRLEPTVVCGEDEADRRSDPH